MPSPLKSAAEVTSRTRTFRDDASTQGWTLNGEGLSSTDRRHFKPQLAAILLIEALSSERAFWHQVQRVREAADSHDLAWTLSLRYSRSNSRRRIVALLLTTAAAATSERDATAALLGLTVRAWFSPDEPPRSRASSYVFRDDFRRVVLEGAQLLAKRAAVRCLEDCAQPAAEGSSYCRRHDSDRSVTRSLRDARERSIERLFRYADPAFERALRVQPNGHQPVASA